MTDRREPHTDPADCPTYYDGCHCTYVAGRADALAEVRRTLITEAPLAIRDDEVAVLSWVDAQLKRLEGLK